MTALTPLGRTPGYKGINNGTRRQGRRTLETQPPDTGATARPATPSAPTRVTGFLSLSGTAQAPRPGRTCADVNRLDRLAYRVTIAPVTTFGQGSPRSTAAMFASVVSAIAVSASAVKKAW